MRRFQILLFFSVAACTSDSEIPKDILPKEKMVEVLIEFHLLEAKIDNLYLLSDSAKQVYEHFEPIVFEKYNVDSAQYMQSLNYYMDQPALLLDIYEVIVDSLMVREKNKDID